MPHVGINVSVNVTQTVALSQERQEELRKEWNARVQDPYAFTPTSERMSGLSVEKARQENEALGQFASRYRKKVIGQCTGEMDLARRQVHYRKIVGVGYGVGYDSKSWLKHGIGAGLETFWIDVSDVACAEARKDFEAQYLDLLPLPTGVHCPRVTVRQGEIQSVLANPEESVGLDVSTVEWWYLCRTLGCLSKSSARIVLEELGKVSLSAEADPGKKNGIIVINALKDYNPCVESCTSNIWTKTMITRNLSRGAGRPVGIFFEDWCEYFNKRVSALTLRAK